MAEAVEVYAYAGGDGFFYSGEHVGVAGDKDEVAELAFESVDDHVGDEAGVDGFLGAAVAPFDELAGAELYAGFVAEGALVAVGAGVGYAVVPELALDGLFEVFSGYLVEEGDDFG